MCQGEFGSAQAGEEGASPAVALLTPWTQRGQGRAGSALSVLVLLQRNPKSLGEPFPIPIFKERTVPTLLAQHNPLQGDTATVPALKIP